MLSSPATESRRLMDGPGVWLLGAGDSSRQEKMLRWFLLDDGGGSVRVFMRYLLSQNTLEGQMEEGVSEAGQACQADKPRAQQPAITARLPGPTIFPR